jgi:isopentenyldiphosphate isomerase
MDNALPATDATVHSNDDQLILVDRNDVAIGTMQKGECHLDGRPPASGIFCIYI